MNTTVFRTACGIFLAAMVTASAQASPFTDDFNDGDDAGWTRYNPLAAFGAPGTVSFPGGNSLRIEAPVSPSYSPLGPARAGELRTDISLADFYLSVDLVDWNNDIDQCFGLLARINQAGLGTSDGYLFRYDPRWFSDHRQGRLSVQILFNEEASDLESRDDITLDPTRDYRMVFEGIGNQLTGRVFDLTNPTVEVGSLTAFNGSFSTGNVGFFLADATIDGIGTADATFDNFYADDVAPAPEPATWLLAVLGLAGFAVSRRSLSG